MGGRKVTRKDVNSVLTREPRPTTDGWRGERAWPAGGASSTTAAGMGRRCSSSRAGATRAAIGTPKSPPSRPAAASSRSTTATPATPRPHPSLWPTDARALLGHSMGGMTALHLARGSAAGPPRAGLDDRRRLVARRPSNNRPTRGSASLARGRIAPGAAGGMRLACTRSPPSRAATASPPTARQNAAIAAHDLHDDLARDRRPDPRHPRRPRPALIPIARPGAASPARGRSSSPTPATAPTPKSGRERWCCALPLRVPDRRHDRQSRGLIPAGRPGGFETPPYPQPRQVRRSHAGRLIQPPPTQPSYPTQHSALSTYSLSGSVYAHGAACGR